MFWFLDDDKKVLKIFKINILMLKVNFYDTIKCVKYYTNLPIYLHFTLTLKDLTDKIFFDKFLNSF